MTEIPDQHNFEDQNRQILGEQSRIAETMIILNGALATLAFSLVNLIGSHVTAKQVINPNELAIVWFAIGFSTLLCMFHIFFSGAIVRTSKANWSSHFWFVAIGFLLSIFGALYLTLFTIANESALFKP